MTSSVASNESRLNAGRTSSEVNVVLIYGFSRCQPMAILTGLSAVPYTATAVHFTSFIRAGGQVYHSTAMYGTSPYHINVRQAPARR